MCKNCQKHFKTKLARQLPFRVLKLIFKAYYTLQNWHRNTRMGQRKRAERPEAEQNGTGTQSVIKEAHQFKGGGDELFHK